MFCALPCGVSLPPDTSSYSCIRLVGNLVGPASALLRERQGSGSFGEYRNATKGYQAGQVSWSDAAYLRMRFGYSAAAKLSEMKSRSTTTQNGFCRVFYCI